MIVHTQREMPFLAAIERPSKAPDELVRQCRHRLDAIVLCIQLSKMSHEEVAHRLGIDKGHMSRILQGRAYFPDTKSVELMALCGNYAPMQYEAMQCGFELYENPVAKREAELEAELAAIRAKKVA